MEGAGKGSKDSAGAPEAISAPVPHYAREGIPEKSRAGLAAMNAGKPLAALNGDATSILDRLRQGTKVKALAAELGCSDSSIYAFLHEYAADEWFSIHAGLCRARLDKAAEDLEDENADQTKISRARESAKLAQWDLERMARKHYGDPKSAGVGVIFQVVVDRSCGGAVTIDGERTG